MAQFDVHVNIRRSAERAPYLVIVQSGLLRRWNRCIVVPLSEIPGFARDPVMTPTVYLGGQAYHFHAIEITNIPRSELGPLVGNLADVGDTLVQAMDAVLARGYGD